MSMMMYQEQLKDHYRFPRNKHVLEDADFTSFDDNPSCGDRVQFQGKIKDGTLVTLCFTGQGCILSQAASSMLVEELEGKDLEAAAAYPKQSLLELIGVQLGPNRVKCALLPFHVLKQGLALLDQK